MNWFEPTEKPENWDKAEQFKNIRICVKVNTRFWFRLLLYPVKRKFSIIKVVFKIAKNKFRSSQFSNEMPCAWVHTISSSKAYSNVLLPYKISCFHWSSNKFSKKFAAYFI